MAEDTAQGMEPETTSTETTESEAPQSTRDVLEAAWDHLENYEREAQATIEKGATLPPDGGKEEEPPPVAPGAPTRDTQGRFTAKPPDGKGSPVVPTPPPTEPRVPTEGVQPPSPSAAPAMRPPRSWRPTLYEAWGKMDPAAQREVLKRERETEHAMQVSAQARQFADEWTRMLSPYAQFIQATGRPPAQLIGSLFQTAHALSSQPPDSKGAIIANIIRAYNVPVEAIAKALDNPSAMQPPQPSQPQGPMYDPRVDQLLQRMQVREQEETRQAAVAADTHLDDFLTANPHATPYLEHMADLMEAAARRGVDMDYEQALNVVLNAYAPDVAQAMRLQAQEQETTVPPVPSSEAASSVRPEHGQRPTGAPKSTREALERAWDLHSGGGRV